jgi:hypothetical protein
MVILGNGQLTELTHQFSLKLIAKQLEVCLYPYVFHLFLIAFLRVGPYRTIGRCSGAIDEYYILQFRRGYNYNVQ